MYPWSHNACNDLFVAKIPLSYMEEVKHQNTGLYISCFQQNHWKILQENDSSHLPNSFVF